MKVALIYSFKESDWFSCTVINKNLRKAYTEIYGDENIIHINYSRKRHVELSDLKCVINTVDKLIFIDHKPTPINFLEKLSKLDNGLSEDREYIIHVFGDYPLYLTEWRSVNELLQGENVKYICASFKQKKYLEKYISQPEIIFTSPFPVNTKRFNLNSINRNKIRAQLEIQEDELVFIYTGRLSYQKRISDMITLFLESLENGNIPKSSKLLLIGEFDLLGLQYLNYSQIHGEYFREIESVLKKSPTFSENIKFLGALKNSELNDYYNAADFYYSLSTYHDEDYGMSVAEAMCTGLPAVLTNWAGYSSFQLKDYSQLCSLVPVALNKFMPILDKKMASHKLKMIAKESFNRKEISNIYDSEFSIPACAKKLENIINTSVPAFTRGTDLMVQLTNEQFIKGNEIFRLETNREFNSFYFKVYDVYAE